MTRSGFRGADRREEPAPIAFLPALLVSFNVFLFASNAYTNLYDVGLSPIRPVLWLAGLLASAALILLLDKQSKLLFELLPAYFLGWLGAFSLYLVFAYLLSSQNEYATRELAESFKFLMTFAVFTALLRIPGGLTTAARSLVVVLLVSVVINVVDFQMNLTEIQGRAAGLYSQPNVAAQLMSLAMVAAAPAVRPRLRWPFCLCVGFGVLITFSRSGWLLWALGIVGLSLVGVLSSRIGSRFITMLKALAVASVVVALLSGLGVSVIDAAWLADTLNPDTQARVGFGASPFSDWSFVDRARAAQYAWESFSSNPWIGGGLGFAYEWGFRVGSHNTFLDMASEGGIAALAIYVVLLGLLWLRTDAVGKVIVALYAASSFVSHNNLDIVALTVMLAVVVARSGDRSGGLVLSHGLPFRPAHRVPASAYDEELHPN